MFRPRTERLIVGTRDSTKLVAGMHKQVQVVGRVLDYLAAGRPVPPVIGVLCFVDANWPLIGCAFTVDGVLVEWPKKTYGRLTQVGSLDAVPGADLAQGTRRGLSPGMTSAAESPEAKATGSLPAHTPQGRWVAKGRLG